MKERIIKQNWMSGHWIHRAVRKNKKYDWMIYGKMDFVVSQNQ